MAINIYAGRCPKGIERKKQGGNKMIIEFIEEGRKGEWEYTGINLEKIETIKVTQLEKDEYKVEITTDGKKEIEITLDKENLYGLETVIEKFYGRVGISVKKVKMEEKNE